MKPIRLSGHARDRLRGRGGFVCAVEEAIRMSAREPAARGRLECRRNFPFHRKWNGVLYVTKPLRPIFVDSTEEIVVVTVYVYDL
jgi:hypothetical protein